MVFNGLMVWMSARVGKLEQEPYLRGGGGVGGGLQDLKQESRYIKNRYIWTKSSSWNYNYASLSKYHLEKL